MKQRVTDLEIKIVHYHDRGQRCTGSNLLYKVDGQRRSSRVNWIANSPALEILRLEKLLRDTGK